MLWNVSLDIKKLPKLLRLYSKLPTVFATGMLAKNYSLIEFTRSLFHLLEKLFSNLFFKSLRAISKMNQQNFYICPYFSDSCRQNE